MHSKVSRIVAVAIPSQLNVQGCSRPQMHCQRHNASIAPTLRPGLFPVAWECPSCSDLTYDWDGIPHTCIMANAWRVCRSRYSSVWSDIIRLVSACECGWKDHTRQGCSPFDLAVWLNYQICCFSICFNESAESKLIQSRRVALRPR